MGKGKKGRPRIPKPDKKFRRLMSTFEKTEADSKEPQDLVPDPTVYKRKIS